MRVATSFSRGLRKLDVSIESGRKSHAKTARQHVGRPSMMKRIFQGASVPRICVIP